MRQMFGGSTADGIQEAAHSGTYHISFRKKEDGVMMCICSTLATAFFGYSKCKVGVMEQFEEGLTNTRCILRISNLKALRDCVCDEQIAVYLTKIHLCDNEDDKAVLMPIQRETVEEGLKKTEAAFGLPSVFNSLYRNALKTRKWLGTVIL